MRGAQPGFSVEVDSLRSEVVPGTLCLGDSALRKLSLWEESPASLPVPAWHPGAHGTGPLACVLAIFLFWFVSSPLFFSFSFLYLFLGCDANFG